MRHGSDLDSLDRWIDEREYRNRSIKSQQQQRLLVGIVVVS